MGNICPCPKRRKEKEFAYDVHEETFEIEENPQIGQHSPKDGQHHENETNVLTEDLRMSSQTIQKHEGNALTSIEDHPIQPFSEKELHKKEEESSALNRVENQPVVEQKKSPINVQQPKQVVQQKPKFHANILKPKTIKKKVNPDDYRFINETQAFRVKKIDSIKQQQFNIDNCKDCIFFIFDITANLYIDDSQNCFIFIAPCQSTVFVRNCKNLVVVAATKQFRTYEVHNSAFSLYCKSQPVIQSSSELVFAPFSCPFYYEQLSKQLSKKKLEPWNNHWSQIHNFTKKAGQVHYRLQKQVTYTDIDWQKAFQQAELEITEGQNPIPFITGQLPYEANNQVLILVSKGVQDSAVENALKGAVILKGFQGVIVGEGKQERKVILIDAVDNIVEKYEEIGKVFSSKEEVSQKKDKWFVNFGDERQK